VDGWLCRVGDCECMAERAYDMLINETKRKAMGDAARQKAVARFNPDDIVTQYENVYKRVLGAECWKLVKG
jgi:L-malate glycosyltransferase